MTNFINSFDNGLIQPKNYKIMNDLKYNIDPDINNQYFELCKQNNLLEAKKFKYENKISLYAVNDNNDTLLHYLIEYAGTRIITEQKIIDLLDNIEGIFKLINIKNKHKQTPMHLIAKFQLYEIYEHVTKQNIQINYNIKDVYGKTPLFYAASGCQLNNTLSYYFNTQLLNKCKDKTKNELKQIEIHQQNISGGESNNTIIDNLFIMRENMLKYYNHVLNGKKDLTSNDISIIYNSFDNVHPISPNSINDIPDYEKQVIDELFDEKYDTQLEENDITKCNDNGIIIDRNNNQICTRRYNYIKNDFVINYLFYGEINIQQLLFKKVFNSTSTNFYLAKYISLYNKFFDESQQYNLEYYNNISEKYKRDLNIIDDGKDLNNILNYMKNRYDYEVVNYLMYNNNKTTGGSVPNPAQHASSYSAKPLPPTPAQPVSSYPTNPLPQTPIKTASLHPAKPLPPIPVKISIIDNIDEITFYNDINKSIYSLHILIGLILYYNEPKHYNNSKLVIYIYLAYKIINILHDDKGILKNINNYYLKIKLNEINTELKQFDKIYKEITNEIDTKDIKIFSNNNDEKLTYLAENINYIYKLLYTNSLIYINGIQQINIKINNINNLINFIIKIYFYCITLNKYNIILNSNNYTNSDDQLKTYLDNTYNVITLRCKIIQSNPPQTENEQNIQKLINFISNFILNQTITNKEEIIDLINKNKLISDKHQHELNILIEMFYLITDDNYGKPSFNYKIYGFLHSKNELQSNKNIYSYKLYYDMLTQLYQINIFGQIEYNKNKFNNLYNNYELLYKKYTNLQSTNNLFEKNKQIQLLKNNIELYEKKYFIELTKYKNIINSLYKYDEKEEIEDDIYNITLSINNVCLDITNNLFTISNIDKSDQIIQQLLQIHTTDNILIILNNTFNFLKLSKQYSPDINDYTQLLIKIIIRLLLMLIINKDLMDNNYYKIKYIIGYIIYLIKKKNVIKNNTNISIMLLLLLHFINNKFLFLHKDPTFVDFIDVLNKFKSKNINNNDPLYDNILKNIPNELNNTLLNYIYILISIMHIIIIQINLISIIKQPVKLSDKSITIDIIKQDINDIITVLQDITFDTLYNINSLYNILDILILILKNNKKLFDDIILNTAVNKEYLIHFNELLKWYNIIKIRLDINDINNKFNLIDTKYLPEIKQFINNNELTKEIVTYNSNISIESKHQIANVIITNCIDFLKPDINNKELKNDNIEIIDNNLYLIKNLSYVGDVICNVIGNNEKNVVLYFKNIYQDIDTMNYYYYKKELFKNIYKKSIVQNDDTDLYNKTIEDYKKNNLLNYIKWDDDKKEFICNQNIINIYKSKNNNLITDDINTANVKQLVLYNALCIPIYLFKKYNENENIKKFIDKNINKPLPIN